MNVNRIIKNLQELSDPDVVREKEKRFGIKMKNALGIYQKDLRDIIKKIGKDSKLAVELYRTGIYEAKLICSKVFDVNDLYVELAEKWIKDFDNWEICDSFSMSIFAKSKFALQFIEDFTRKEAEFEKRSGFAVMAAYCMADKKSENELFESFFPIIIREANDDRFYVKKAVNWALRGIGKRNIDLNRKAIKVAEDLIRTENKTAVWIAKDAIRELISLKVSILDYPRDVYRPKE